MTLVPERRVLCAPSDGKRRDEFEDAMKPWRVVMAANAFEVIRMSNAEPFDAYVLDYWLPDWSGIALCRHIRKTDPHAPICIYTRTDTDEQRKRARRAGVNAYVVHDEGAKVLAGALRTLLRDADARSAQARLEEERAIQEELQRRARLAIADSEQAKERAAQAIERTARAKAMKAFVEAGGALAYFERWWPQSYPPTAGRVVVLDREAREHLVRLK